MVDKQKIQISSFSCERNKKIGIRNFQRQILIEMNFRENTKKLPKYLFRNIQNIIAIVNKLIF